MQLIASQCRARGNLGAKIFEGMFAAMPSYASNAAAAVFALNHVPCKDIAARYLAAVLNDISRSSGLVQELIDGCTEYLEVRRVLCVSVPMYCLRYYIVTIACLLDGTPMPSELVQDLIDARGVCPA